MKASKVEIESSFYEYLTRVLTAEEAEKYTFERFWASISPEG